MLNSLYLAVVAGLNRISAVTILWMKGVLQQDSEEDLRFATEEVDGLLIGSSAFHISE